MNPGVREMVRVRIDKLSCQSYRTYPLVITLVGHLLFRTFGHLEVETNSRWLVLKSIEADITLVSSDPRIKLRVSK